MVMYRTQVDLSVLYVLYLKKNLLVIPLKNGQTGLKMAVLGGLAASYAIWFGSSYFLGTPFLASLILAPLTVLGELPSVKWIDDNATMVLLPLIVLLILESFF